MDKPQRKPLGIMLSLTLFTALIATFILFKKAPQKLTKTHAATAEVKSEGNARTKPNNNAKKRETHKVKTDNNSKRGKDHTAKVDTEGAPAAGEATQNQSLVPLSWKEASFVLIVVGLLCCLSWYYGRYTAANENKQLQQQLSELGEKTTQQQKDTHIEQLKKFKPEVGDADQKVLNSLREENTRLSEQPSALQANLKDFDNDEVQETTFIDVPNNTNRPTLMPISDMQLNALQRGNSGLKQQLSQVRNKHPRYRGGTAMERDVHSYCQQTIGKLKEELAEARSIIMGMTTVVGVQQPLPTVQECIRQYQSIEEQKYHNTSITIKKFIQKKNNKYQEYYIKQVVHQLMFELLTTSYNEVQKYYQDVYKKIGDVLNMNKAIAKGMNIRVDDEKEQEENEEVKEERLRILKNILGNYFKSNFKFVLEKALPIQDKNKTTDNVSQGETNLVTTVWNSVKTRFEEYVEGTDNDIMEAIQEYIIECCQVFWAALLQDPPLRVYPLTWQPDKDDHEMKIYDEKIHQRVLGSDKKCKNILYVVWPALVNKEGYIASYKDILGDQKIDVVLRNKMYTPYKF